MVDPKCPYGLPISTLVFGGTLHPRLRCLSKRPDEVIRRWGPPSLHWESREKDLRGPYEGGPDQT